MNGIVASPIRVGAKLLNCAIWSGFSGSGSFLLPNDKNDFFFGSGFLDSSSSPPLMIAFENLTKYLIMFPGMITEAKHCQMRQSSQVVKTAGVKFPPSLPY